MKKIVADIKKYYKYAIYSGKSELKTEIANSHLSWLWWILDPLFFMMVYSFIALIVFNKGEKYFPVFVFLGLTVWQFFEKNVKASVKLISNNRQIVTKVYIPKFIFLAVKIASNGFKMFVSFSLIVVMMIIYRVPVSLNLLWCPLILFVLVLLTFGVGSILMHFGVFIEDLSNVMNVVLRIIFYMSGIFYSITNRIDEPYSSILLNLNPVALAIDSFRRCLLYSTCPNVIALLIWGVIGFIFSMIGLSLIYKYENSYVKVM